jgi:hypothetical protein
MAGREATHQIGSHHLIEGSLLHQQLSHPEQSYSALTPEIILPN